MNTSIPPLLRDIFVAYEDAKKNKSNTQTALKFSLNYESNLLSLYEDIIALNYEISPSTCFIIKKPVMREIFAGDFRDRIVHHLIFNYLSPVCERIFSNDSYACRVGKGTSYGIRRADHFIRSVSKNYTQECYILKLDISGYFMSINREILYQKVSIIVWRFEKHIPCERTLILYLIKKVIFHNHVRNCIMNGKKKDWEGLPKSKSLFYAKSGCGLPIGNLTSQLFGNVYLNDFDHFATRLSHGYYGRYVDDMLFVSFQKEVLTVTIHNVRTYLKEHLKLTLHPRKIYLQSYTKGVDFLGVSIRVGRMYPRHRLKGSIYNFILYWNSVASENGGVLTESQSFLFQSTINSYLGSIASCRTRKLRKKLLDFISVELKKYISCRSPYRQVFLNCVRIV
jgi:retron-type reverse transcriptase